MIQFAADPALTTKSVSYYVWELFAATIMTHTLPTTSSFNPLYYVAGKDETTSSYIFKSAVYNSTDRANNNASVPVPVSLAFADLPAGTKAMLTVLTGPENPYGYNDPFTGINVVKTANTSIVADAEGVFNFELPNMSVAVLKTESVASMAKSKRSLMRRGNRLIEA
jgi:alpha-L-arabinofuranosidase